MFNLMRTTGRDIMKLKALALTLLLATPLAQAGTLPDRIVGCHNLTDLQELIMAVVKQDVRLLKYKLNNGCMMMRGGLKYSVLGESYRDDHTSWSEIKIYSGGKDFDMFVSKRHLNK